MPVAAKFRPIRATGRNERTKKPATLAGIGLKLRYCVIVNKFCYMIAYKPFIGFYNTFVYRGSVRVYDIHPVTRVTVCIVLFAGIKIIDGGIIYYYGF
jgi:hypothetical protein